MPVEATVAVGEAGAEVAAVALAAAVDSAAAWVDSVAGSREATPLAAVVEAVRAELAPGALAAATHQGNISGALAVPAVPAAGPSRACGSVLPMAETAPVRQAAEDRAKAGSPEAAGAISPTTATAADDSSVRALAEADRVRV